MRIPPKMNPATPQTDTNASTSRLQFHPVSWWLFELLILCGVVVGASLFIFWRREQFPGGLHWENYFYTFFSGYVTAGCATAHDLWQAVGNSFGFTVLLNVVQTWMHWMFGVDSDGLGTITTCGILAVWTAAFVYILARICMGRLTGVAAVILLLGSPCFITHTLCGNYIAILNMAAAIPCVALFVLAHRFKSLFYLLAAAYCLSWSYLAAYVSFPTLMIALSATFLAAAVFCRQSLLKLRWYLLAVAVFGVSVLINSAWVSVYYCHQEPLFAIKTIEARAQGVLWLIRDWLSHGSSTVQPTAPAKLQIDQVLFNASNMVLEFFVRSSPSYKTFAPAIPAAVWPFDHLGSTLPGTPGMYLPTTILLIIGVIGMVSTRRFDAIAIALIWLALLLLVTVALSYHSRRLIIVVPFMALTAAFGLSWLAERFFEDSPCTKRTIIALIPSLVLAYAAYDMNVCFRQYSRSLQFDSYRGVGQYIMRHLNPKNDVIVLLDKSVMFPVALYAETHFRPYRFAVMSEFYFPVLLASDDGNLPPLAQETYSYDLRYFPYLFRYCNMKFPSGPFDLAAPARQPAWEQFHTLLRSESQKGHQLYLLASLAEEQSLEAGSQYLYQFLLTELERRNVGMYQVASFGQQPSGRPHAMLLKLALPPK